MKLEPGDRAGEATAMHHGALVPGRRVQVSEVSLNHENLTQVVHVASSERQYAEAGAKLLCAAVMLIQEPEREQQRSQQEGVRQHFTGSR